MFLLFSHHVTDDAIAFMNLKFYENFAFSLQIMQNIDVISLLNNEGTEICEYLKHFLLICPSFDIQRGYLLAAVQWRRHGGTGGGGRISPFVTRIDFLIRPNPRRNCRGRGEISQIFHSYFNISLNCLP